MAPKQPRTLWDKILRAVRNDPQKAGILTVLVSILVVLQVRLQMSERDAGPAQASANTAGGGGGDGTDNPPPFGASAVETHVPSHPIDSGTALRQWMETPGAPLTRNLFQVELE